MISLVVLALVFILIAVRRVGRIRLQIWQVMLLGAVVVLVLGQISPRDAVGAVNLDVMVFLLGMFAVGQAMEESGYLSYLSYRVFRHARTSSALLLAVLFVMGLFSALVMNDTMAIIGTPVVLLLARSAHLRPQSLLVALACAVTIGSVASPIGNPQNLLVALHGDVANPFVTFGKSLLVPTLVCLVAAYWILRMLYRRDFGGTAIVHISVPLADPALARLCKASLVVLVAMLLLKIMLVFSGIQLEFRLTYIAIGAALPVLLGSPKRSGIMKRIDWTTLVFFAAMFILVQSVWLSGYLQRALESTDLDTGAPGVILIVSILASQVLSNVPLTALYLPLLGEMHVPVSAYMALAAGATMAGTLTVLGAASNVIIIQNAEKRCGVVLTFAEFARAGIPVTAVCLGVYWLFLAF